MPDDVPPIDSERAVADAKRLREDSQRLVNQARNIEQRIIFDEANAALDKQERANGAGKRGILADAPGMPHKDENEKTAEIVRKLSDIEP